MAKVREWLASARTLLFSIFFAAALAGCGGKVDLLASIPESDANEVIAALINAGIAAQKVPGKEGMVGVRVDQSKVAQAVDTLRAAGLPKEAHIGMGQVFKKDGLISSPLEERARYLYALSQDLSATLARIDGVLFARVHLVLPERGASNSEDTPSSAAVFIKHATESDVDLLQPQVRRMVANSIPGLATERVTVVFVPSSPNAQQPSAAQWTNVLGMRLDPAALTTFWGIIIGLGALLLLSLAAIGFLFWRYVLPSRQGSARASDSERS